MRIRRRGTRLTWTPEEDRLLTQLWSECVSAAEIMRRIPRSWIAIYAHARQVLRLPPVPQGFVTVAAAARRCGIDDKTLRYVLRMRRVPLHPCYPCARSALLCRPRTQPGRVVVEWDAAREAVEWWCTCETPSHAARRLGVDRETVLRALARIGVHVQRSGRGSRVWVECAVIDRAMEAA